MWDMKDDGFLPEDFGIEGMSSEKLLECHGELAARYKNAVTIEVQSSNGRDWYNVTHDFSLVLDCDCAWAQFHRGKCRKHGPRAQEVLNRRRAHNHTAPPAKKPDSEERWTKSSLNEANRGFNIERR
jgi:hypothetical protein